MRKKLKEKKYVINYYSAKKLLENGYLEDDFLVCDEDATYYSLLGSFPHEDCILFDQTIKALGLNANITEIFIILDFNGVGKVTNFLPFKNGIKLNFNGKEIIFQDYLKSNSMNKNSRIYYINSDYYNIIHERISFGFDKVNKVPLSKWYAYSGLSLSDATILIDINITVDELCVIPDKIEKKQINCITAISIPILVDILYEYQERIEKHLKSPRFNRTANIYYEEMYIDEEILLKDCCYQGLYLEDLDEEIDCYYNSDDFSNLPKDIQKLLEEIIELKECNIDDILDLIDDLIYKYESILDPNEITWHKISVKNYNVKINCFDGEGLISLDFAKEINNSLSGNKIQMDEDEEERESKLENINSFQIRLPFLKGVIHSTDIAGFCAKHKVEYIEGIHSFSDGTMRKYDVKKLKLIITESQFKAANFMRRLKLNMDDYFELLAKYDYHIAVSGVEPKEKNEVRLCYQFLSTLPLKPDEVEYLIENNKLALYDVIEQDNVIEGLELSSTKTYPTGIEFFKINQLFYVSTDIYSDKRRDLFEVEKNNLALGKLRVNGTRKYLASDLLTLLYHMIGKQKPSVSMNLNEFYCPNTVLNSKCIVLRNPHYSRNEIVITNNATGKYKERDEFFGHLTGIYMVNPMSLIADRLGGADYDGDEVCIINDDLLLEKVYPRLINKNNTYVYQLVKIPSVTNHLNKGDSLYAKHIYSLESTFSNRTGIISNLAFEKTLNAYWSLKPNMKEISDVSFFTVLGGLEIDSCKNGKKPNLPKRKGETIEYLKVKDIFLKKRKNDEASELKTYIKTINEQSSKNTLYYVFKTFMEQRIPKLDSGFMFDYFDVCDDGFIKTVAITEAYNHAVGVLKSDDFNNKDTLLLKASIEHEISQILKENKYHIDTDTLLMKFERNAVSNFKKYFNREVRFHFLQDLKEKEDYLINYLGIKNLTSDEIYAICDFKNLGYKLLYLLMYFNYLTDWKSRMCILLENYSYNGLKYIDKNIKKKITDYESVYAYIEEYLMKVSNFIEKSSNREEMILKINRFFKKEAVDLDYETILSVINPLESRMIFTVYNDQVKKYLLELEDNKNE